MKSFFQDSVRIRILYFVLKKSLPVGRNEQKEVRDEHDAGLLHSISRNVLQWLYYWIVRLSGAGCGTTQRHSGSGVLLCRTKPRQYISEKRKASEADRKQTHEDGHDESCAPGRFLVSALSGACATQKQIKPLYKTPKTLQ